MLKSFWTALTLLFIFVSPQAGTRFSPNSRFSLTPEPDLNSEIANQTQDNKDNNNPDDDPIVPPN